MAKDFFDTEVEPKEEFLALDLQTSDNSFIPAPDALALCLKKVEEGKPSLSDEDFEDRLIELGIESFGRDFKLQADSDKVERVGSCNLMKDKVVIEDELQKVASI